MCITYFAWVRGDVKGAASFSGGMSYSLGCLLRCTPYSTNRLFSEFVWKFEGAFLEVYETISGGSGEVFRGNIKENNPEKNKDNIRKILFDAIKYYLN